MANLSEHIAGHSEFIKIEWNNQDGWALISNLDFEKGGYTRWVDPETVVEEEPTPEELWAKKHPRMDVETYLKKWPKSADAEIARQVRDNRKANEVDG